MYTYKCTKCGYTTLDNYTPNVLENNGCYGKKVHHNFKKIG